MMQSSGSSMRQAPAVATATLPCDWRNTRKTDRVRGEGVSCSFDHLATRIAAFALLLLTPLWATPPPVSIERRYHQLPLRFEANAGQAEGPVRFLARRDSTVFSLAPEGMSIVQPGAAVRLRFEGGVAQTMEGTGRLHGLSHYYIGNDPSHWYRNIPNFSAVRYGKVWPGVDVVFYGEGGEVEYDLVLSPEADLSKVVIAVEGASSVAMETNGDLRIRAGHTELQQRRLRVFQQVRGERKQLAARYKMLGRNRFGFDVPHYDRRRGLTIDPVLSYTAALSQVDRVTATALDPSGNSSVAGSLVTSAGDRNLFVTRFDSSGATILFNATFGGTKDDSASGIAVDGAGNAFVVGATASADFPVAGGYQSLLNGTGACLVCNTDAFLMKLNPNGSLNFSSFYGGTGNDYATDVTLDRAGNVYIGGVAGVGASFPVTQGALKTNIGSVAGQDDGFVMKTSNSNPTPIYSTLLGGAESDKVWSIGVDGGGNLYATGVTFSSDFPVTADAFQRVLTPAHNAFLVKLNPAGSALLYGTYYGGGSTFGAGLAVDEFGRSYVAVNQVLSGILPRETVPGTLPNVTSQASLAKFNSLGSEVLAQFPITGAQFGMGVAVNAAGNAFVTGSTGNSVFGSTGDAFVSNVTPSQAFLAVLSQFGTSPVFSTILGTLAPPVGVTPATTAAGLRLALDSSSSAYVAGIMNFSSNLSARNYLAKVGGFSLAPCSDASLSVAPSSISFAGGSGAVTIQTSCAWFAVPGSSSVTGPVSGSGNSNFGFTVSGNSNALPRPLSISAAGKIIGLMQRGANEVPPYEDVALSSGFSDFIAVLKNKAITSGCAPTGYCPDGVVTRGQMAVFIMRSVMGGDNFPYPTAPYFSDVPASHSFFKWIQKMREMGITTGCGTGTFCPGDSVTRGQVAVFLIRARFGNAFSYSQVPYFGDVPVSHPLFAYVQKMKETGITTGCTAGNYCPDDPNSRGQMAVFVIRGFFTPW